MEKRTGLTGIGARPLTLCGPDIQPGRKAPDFTALDTDLNPISLSRFLGRIIVLLSLPSLDTPVCDLETRRFSGEAVSIGGNIVVLAISMDLPFAQKRWCAGRGLDRVVTLSDHRDAEFGQAYGVLVEEMRLLARAVFVIDRQGVVIHAQITPDLGGEPDYGAAMQAAFDAGREGRGV